MWSLLDRSPRAMLPFLSNCRQKINIVPIVSKFYYWYDPNMTSLTRGKRQKEPPLFDLQADLSLILIPLYIDRVSIN